MSRFIDLTNQRFGRLTVKNRSENTKHGKARWECQCSCGNVVTVKAHCLRTGFTKSCGCLKGEVHSMYKFPEYRTWGHMIDRCNNPNNQDFKHYGGRGIFVCESWVNSFLTFFKDMGNRPTNTTIDRINNDLGYFKDNCKWSTHQEQMNNRRNNHRFTVNGWNLTLTQWAKFVGMDNTTLRNRIKNNWPPQKAIFTPVKHKKP